MKNKYVTLQQTTTTELQANRPVLGNSFQTNISCDFHHHMTKMYASSFQTHAYMLNKQEKKFDFILHKIFGKLKSKKIVTLPQSYRNQDYVLTEHYLFLYSILPYRITIMKVLEPFNRARIQASHLWLMTS